MGIERYIAAASMGLYIMFAAEVNVLYDFLEDPHRMIEATPKLLQFISIGVAPASVLASVAYIMARRYGSKPIGTMILAGGAAMMLGMAIAHTRLDRIDPKFVEPAIEITPIMFAAISIPVMLVGAALLREKSPKRRSSLDFASWSQSDD